MLIPTSNFTNKHFIYSSWTFKCNTTPKQQHGRYWHAQLRNQCLVTFFGWIDLEISSALKFKDKNRIPKVMNILTARIFTHLPYYYLSKTWQVKLFEIHITQIKLCLIFYPTNVSTEIYCQQKIVPHDITTNTSTPWIVYKDRASYFLEIHSLWRTEEIGN